MLPPLANDSILRQRYKITNIVGQGGMGSIYQAEDLRLPGRYCAIKEVQPDRSLTPELQAQAQQQFLQEASILARLDHPNLPKVSDFFNDSGRDYLVMDFVPGQDLRQILRETWENNTPILEKTVLDWATQIIDALIYLHQHTPPVLHRDIKPSNIRLNPNGRIKLVDFGLVKLLDEDDARTITVVQGRGTAFYTPLEQYGGDSGHTDVRSDIYALGATLYHLFTGRNPPSAKERFLNPHQLQKPTSIVPQLSQKVAESLLWAMEMHPEDRPESMALFAQALLGNGRRPMKTTPPLFNQELGEALRANQTLLIFALTLFLLAILLTIL